MNTVDITHIDAILTPFKGVIKDDWHGYRNHIIRVLHLCFLQKAFTPEEQKMLEIAACFHDIALWTHQTVDYLLPSAQVAASYLEQQQLSAWIPAITAIITEHHKVKKVALDSPFENNINITQLAEIFRKADWADFTLGMVNQGIDTQAIKRIQAQYPNSGFHKTLMRKGLRWFLSHPFNPLPMFKW